MLNIRINAPRTGFFLLAASLIFTIIGFCYFFSSYAVFGFQLSRWVIALTVIAFWSMLLLLGNALYAGDHPYWISLLYLVVTFCLTLAAIEFVKPGIGNIATYFTVSMGDMETYAIAVPQTITGVAMYVVAAILSVVAAFFRPARTPQKSAMPAEDITYGDGGQN